MIESRDEGGSHLYVKLDNTYLFDLYGSSRPFLECPDARRKSLTHTFVQLPDLKDLTIPSDEQRI